MRIIYNSIFLQHDTGSHPENPARLSMFSHLKDSRIVNGEGYLKLTHSDAYIEYVKKTAKEKGSLSQDTPLSEKSFEVACYAVGAAIGAAETQSFALVRPPGHHASENNGMGFCLFNNIAIAAKYLLKKGKRVFVFDFDLHHGNGTQAILESEENCHYFSIHQADAFPGTGTESGKNFSNYPLHGTVLDVTYVRLLEQKLAPALKEFAPDIVAVSAGFDSYYKDKGVLGPNTGFELTKRSYEKIKEILAKYPHFMVLEGGYNPESVFEGANVFAEI
ncbi:MAG: histone deacetylase [Candidatus Diapherotrites archaeon]